MMRFDTGRSSKLDGFALGSVRNNNGKLNTLKLAGRNCLENPFKIGAAARCKNRETLLLDRCILLNQT
jgi:hypothetical protein